MNRRGGRAGGRGDRMQRPGFHRSAPQPGDWKFGTVYALKDTFGFLRPTHRTEDVYFSLRDAPRDTQQGDFVYYLEEEGSKGPAARDLNLLPFHEQSVTGSSIKAVVKADASNPSRKGSAGILTIQDPNSSLDGYDVPFIAEDVANARRGIFHGDIVECDVAEIPRLGYLRAQNVRLLQSARDIRRAREVQQMLEAGLPRDQGIIDTLKADFGFIRCADRRDDVFFRIEDVKATTESENGTDNDLNFSNIAKPGTEVEFFIISEAGKDGLRNRAMYIDVLPQGTVQFEVGVHKAVTGVVSVLPRVSGSKEVPGIVLVNRDQYPDVADMPDSVELWPRVMATTLDLQQGDILQLDVMKYRPERIFFARNVSVKEFNPLLREYGIISRVKDGSFGFIRSSVREGDIYFRFDDVLQADGRPMDRDQIVENIAVSYDNNYSVDERARKKQDALRWRATRIIPCDPELCRDYIILQRNFRGVVTKEAQKQTQTGTVKLTAHPSAEAATEGQTVNWRSDELGEIDIPPEIEYQDIASLLHRFMQQPSQQEISLVELSPTHKRALALLCDSYKLGYESQSAGTGGLGPNIMKVWRFASAEEFDAWAVTKPPIILSRKDKKMELLPYTRAHTNEQFGVVCAGMEVTFSVCLDRRTLTRFAGEVTATDAPVTNGEVRRFGIVDALRNKGKISVNGFIRDLDTQEKLNFCGQDFQDSGAATQVALGSVVSYGLRNRGGFRAAVAVCIEEGQTPPEVELDGQCTAVIVAQPAEAAGATGSLAAVLVDTSGVSAIADVYIHLEPGMTNPGLELVKEPAIPGEPLIRFFAPAIRSPLPLTEGVEVAVGDLVHCAVIVNQAASRLPVRVRVTERIESSEPCRKVEGSITRLESAVGEVAIDAKLLGEAIEETKSTGAFSNSVVLAFDSRQLTPAESSPAEKPTRAEVGDMLECIAIPSLKIALPLTFQKPQRRERPRLIVNEGLKTRAKLKTGVIMAKGPDGTNGFVPGWRPKPDVSQHAWAGLFHHLQDL